MHLSFLRRSKRARLFYHYLNVGTDLSGFVVPFPILYFFMLLKFEDVVTLDYKLVQFASFNASLFCPAARGRLTVFLLC